MVILELAAANVQGFSSGRFAFRPGYLALKAPRPEAVPLAGIVTSLAISGTNVIVGGSFTRIGGLNRNSIAKVNLLATDAADPSWDPNASDQ